MARLAVLIHGMWGTSGVWHHWRPFLEERGWQSIAPSLRHHDVPSHEPPVELGTTSLLDYAADLEKMILDLPEKPVVIQARWAWWKKPHKATLDEALACTFDTADRAKGENEYSAFVHESGRALLEIGLPWLDGTRAGTVDPRRVTVPLLFVAAEKDRLVPPGVVQRTAKLFAHVSDYVEHEDQGHWVLGQPGWQRVADHAEAWLTGKVH